MAIDTEIWTIGPVSENVHLTELVVFVDVQNQAS